MRKSEEKKLYMRITEYIGKKITWLVTVESWTVTEVAEACGLPLNRVSEIKNHSKYQRPINETFLAAFLGGGIITMSELKEKVVMDTKEREYMDSMAFYEDKTLRKSIQSAKGAGVDVVPILLAAEEAAKEGIDVVKLIEEARKNK